MKEELERWKRIKKQCEQSIDEHGAIINATTDRGVVVLRKHPAIEALKTAEKKIEELEKIVGSTIDLD
jgi:hypothetical protein|tara:strand:+ start:40 stop:243 length:204 start_codon:yes stop_codon:yes gene_type:complete